MKDGMEVEPCVLSKATDLGEQYIRAMTLAGEYAYAGRDWVCDRVARLLSAPIVESVHNHHNFAWREEHDGEQYRGNAHAASAVLRSDRLQSSGDFGASRYAR